MVIDSNAKKSKNRKSGADFIAACPWGHNRAVAVYRRRHQGRKYVNLRVWNRHTTYRYWYPSRRYFTIPAGDADALAEAIRAAARGEVLGSEPDWCRESEERHREWKRLHSQRPCAGKFQEAC